MIDWNAVIYVLVAVPWVALTAFIVFFACITWREWSRKNHRAAAGAALMAVSPFLLYGFTTTSNEAGAAARIATVAAFARTPMPADHPRTLEVYTQGEHVARLATSVMVGTGEFDRVVWVNTYSYPAHKRATVHEMRFARTEDCRKDAAIARDVHFGRGKQNTSFDFGKLNRCIIRGDEESLAQTSFGEAVVLLAEHTSPLRSGKSDCDAAEVRLRRGEEEVLVDYWEDYCYERVGFPLTLLAGLGDKRKHTTRVMIRPIRLLEKTLHPEETGLTE